MIRKLLSVAALLGALLVLAAGPAGADDFIVTSTVDSHDPGTLRWAVDQANSNPGPDTITLGAGLTYDLTLPGGDDTNVGGDLDSIEGSLTIIGNGSTIRQTVTDEKVLDQDVKAPSVIEVRNLTMTGGDATANGGAIWSDGDIVVTDSRITGNHADGDGGGLWADSGPITVTRSTVSGNTAGGNGGGIYEYDSGPVTVVESTISGNSAGALGGGIYAYDDVEMHNSTVTGNTAGDGGGGLFLEAYELSGTFLTISGNTGPGGANIDVGQGGEVALFGSVVSNPLGAGTNCGGVGTASSAGYNYEAGGDTCGFDQATDVVDGGDPLLGALADNGGPTQTMLPATASPLVDQIPGTEAGCTGTDQRGVARPQVGGCDIGAVELEAVPPTTTTTAPPVPTAVVTPAFTG